jgi:hypothetical protein
MRTRLQSVLRLLALAAVVMLPISMKTVVRDFQMRCCHLVRLALPAPICRVIGRKAV